MKFPVGHVLDVATGNGGFIHELISGLKDYDDILGIDIKEKAESAFVESFKGEPKDPFPVDGCRETRIRCRKF